MQTQSDKIQNRTWKVLLRMHTFNGKIKIRLRMRILNGKMKLPVTHAHIEENLHSAPVHSRLKSYIACTVTKTMVCNTCERELLTRVKLGTRPVVLASLWTHTRLWLVLQTSHTGLESPSSRTCNKIYYYLTVLELFWKYSRISIIRHSVNRPSGLSDLLPWAEHSALSDQNRIRRSEQF